MGDIRLDGDTGGVAGDSMGRWEVSKVMYASELMELARKNPEAYEGKRYTVTDTLIDRHSREYETAIVRSGALRGEGENELFAHINSITRLEEIPPEPKPVPFMEAVEAYSEGKTIEVQHGVIRRTYTPKRIGGDVQNILRDQNGLCIGPEEILNGKWFICK